MRHSAHQYRQVSTLSSSKVAISYSWKCAIAESQLQGICPKAGNNAVLHCTWLVCSCISSAEALAAASHICSRMG